MKVDFVWDISAALGPLEALQNPALAGRMALVAAESYTDSILDWISAGNSFTSRTGRLEQSIGWRPDGEGAVIYANAETAPYLEYGTGIHGQFAADYAAQGGYVIKPKAGRKALRIPGAFGDSIRRQVIHPGIQPKPYFFADFDSRENSMLDAALGVLATTLDRTYYLDRG